MNTSDEPIYYRRRLPHYQPADHAFFITFRLANSLPAHVLQELREERARERDRLDKQLQDRRLTQQGYYQALYQLHKKMFARFDAWLDRCTESPRWLADDAIAQEVAEQIHDLNQKRYSLQCFCIMSNHVHLLIDTAGFSQVSETNVAGKTIAYPLTDTVRLLKGRTARYANQILRRSGAFWHHESYDHVVRDAGEHERIIQYIINNPVKAGLVQDWRDWKYTFLSPEFYEA